MVLVGNQSQGLLLMANECPNDLWLMWRNKIIPFPCHFLEPFFSKHDISEKQKHVFEE